MDWKKYRQSKFKKENNRVAKIVVNFQKLAKVTQPLLVIKNQTILYY